MFTGIVEEIGRVQAIQKTAEKLQVRIAATQVLDGSRIGDSIAVDGVCQTLTQLDNQSFTVEVLQGSLEKTTLGQLAQNQRVNLERAMALGQRMGGHLVQGHINGMARVQSIEKNRDNVFLTVRIPGEYLKYCIAEGSIALHGVSLTIYRLQGSVITVNIIPHTWENTVLRELTAGARINFEVDLIARHIEALLQLPSQGTSGLNQEKLALWGYQ